MLLVDLCSLADCARGTGGWAEIIPQLLSARAGISGAFTAPRIVGESSALAKKSGLTTAEYLLFNIHRFT